MSISEKYIAELYNKIQEERPIIHCITNAVTVNDCANILLAAGASPTMAHHPLEVEESPRVRKHLSAILVQLLIMRRWKRLEEWQMN